MGTAYFLTHPIQYQTPLLQALKVAGVNLKVVYASTSHAWDEQNWHDRIPLTWDIPLLDGYDFDTAGQADRTGGFWAQVQHYRREIRCWLKQNPVNTAWIHGWGNPFAFAALLEARRANIRILLRGESHLGCVKGPAWRKLAHRKLLGMLFKRVAHFLAIGSANRQFYLNYGVDANRITLVPYVVDNLFFRHPVVPLPDDFPFSSDPFRPIVLFAGKLATHKGVDILLTALATATKSLRPGTSPRLVIVGEGPNRAELETQANELLPGSVWFAGFRNQMEMPAFYAMADVFVLPSRFEPWGLVVNEVMNAGKPVVASNAVGSRHDLVHPGVNGEIFASGDSASLSTALVPLLDNPVLRQQYGRQSLSVIDHWGIPEAVQNIKWVLDPSSAEKSRCTIPVLQGKRTSTKTVEPRGTISVTYAHVHNAYQLAQAASDAGRLERFYTSCVNAEGHWGGWISRIIGPEAMASRSGLTLQSHTIVENPWPMLRGRLLERFSKGNRHDWLAVNAEFDRWVAPRLDRDPCDLLLSSETGAQHSFRRARQLGKRCLLDCPQFHPDLLWNLLAEAADRCSLPKPPPIDTPETAARKREEFDLAHHFLVFSPLHAASFTQAGYKKEQVIVSPLWIDPAVWYAETRPPKPANSPLRLLFVGGASLRKGVPFLLQAIAGCGTRVHLTLAGKVDTDMMPHIHARESQCTFIGPQTKPALRRLYASHDLLVLPSVADAFGLVALEAMACGVPVLVTDKCGVPVPESSWRVPSLDAQVLQQRFEHYIRCPELLPQDGATALQFAANLTAATYRNAMQQIFAFCLGESDQLPPAPTL